MQDLSEERPRPFITWTQAVLNWLDEYDLRRAEDGWFRRNDPARAQMMRAGEVPDEPPESA